MSSHRNRPRFVLLTPLLLAVLACSAPLGGVTDALQTATALALTGTPQVAEVTPAQTATLPTTPTQALPTTAAPTATQPAAATTAPTTASAASATPTTGTGCNYDSVYQSDVTIPDNTQLVAGQTFTKTWRIKNNGCQAWPAGTTLVFISGTQMSSTVSVSVPQTAANGVQDISVNMTAPTTPGDYRGDWQLKTPSGTLFGDPVYLKIKVVAATPTPTTPATTAATTVFTPTITLTPTPIQVNFTLTYVGGMWSCSAGSVTLYNYTAIVQNTGPNALQSVSWTLQQPVGTVVNTQPGYDVPFQTSPTNANCNDSSLSSDSLAPGASAWVSSFRNTPLTTGVPARAAFKFCTQNAQGGFCKEANMDFTP